MRRKKKNKKSKGYRYPTLADVAAVAHKRDPLLVPLAETLMAPAPKPEQWIWSKDMIVHDR